MSSYERPTSIELEVQPKDDSQIPLKQKDILNDLFEIAKMAGLPHKPIGGFQKNTDGTFTITLNCTEHKNILMSFLSKNSTLGAFIYHPSSADSVGGQVTLIGAPNEYPNHKLHAALSVYVDIVRIKNGSYKEHPEVRNGVKHLTFKKIYRPYPSQLKLPEGFQIKTKTDGSEEKQTGCYRCGGDHLIRDCTIDQRYRNQHQTKASNIQRPMKQTTNSEILTRQTKNNKIIPINKANKTSTETKPTTNHKPFNTHEQKPGRQWRDNTKT